MAAISRSVFVLVLAAVLVHAEKVRYDGHRVYTLQPDSRMQVDALRSFQQRSLHSEVSFWTDSYGEDSSVDVMVSPHQAHSFEQTMDALGIPHTLRIPDVQRLVDLEQPLTQSSAESFSWQRYHRLDEIHDWLRSLEARYPGVVTLQDAGRSYEGRSILGVKVSYKSGNKAVFIEGGIHAREWISPATVTYMLDQLLNSSDPRVRNVSENFDWYIFPNTNPDGYEYTHTTDRMWRKSRRLVGSYDGEDCYGVDLNRNWGFHWSGDDFACSETYPGPSAFSEVETAALSDYIGNSSHVDIYVSYHSYGQKIMYPYGVLGVRPSNEAQLKSVASAAAASLAARYGTKYEVGMIMDIEYEAPGSSVDWAAGSEDSLFAFAYELRDLGQYGFVLPADQIIPTAQETLDSLLTLVSQSRQFL